MNYDPSKLPKRPYAFSSDYDNLIYIGKGTEQISIAQKYNNGEPFQSYFCYYYGHKHCSELRLEFNSGIGTHGYYFVKKDSPMLPKMFPLEILASAKSLIEQIRVDVAIIIANVLEDTHDKSKLTSILKAMHEKIISVAQENEIDINEIISTKTPQCELSEDILI